MQQLAASGVAFLWQHKRRWSIKHVWWRFNA